MDPTRYTRTPKGHDEIAQGRKNLRGKLRTVLFLVDAGKPGDDIQRQVTLIGAPADALAQLAAAGYIVETGQAAAQPGAGAVTTERQLEGFRVAKAFMNESIVDARGIRAFAFTLKLERCATPADLAELLPAFAEALVKSLDRDAARALVDRARELIAAGAG
ncbi:MAG TPA: hypothetical protein VFQ55_12305 [Casimicrobiaceae bacterium]|nr:hypothetical protein [Casimicrobiaceae bacterium]